MPLPGGLVLLVAARSNSLTQQNRCYTETVALLLQKVCCNTRRICELARSSASTAISGSKVPKSRAAFETIERGNRLFSGTPFIYDTHSSLCTQSCVRNAGRRRRKREAEKEEEEESKSDGNTKKTRIRVRTHMWIIRHKQA